MSSSSEEIRDYILVLTKEYVGRKTMPKPSDKLFHDLGLTGDDAWEFFDQVSRHYNIRETQFDLSLYFPSEGDVGIWPINLFFKIDKSKWKPMTIDDVVRFIVKSLATQAKEK